MAYFSTHNPPIMYPLLRSLLLLLSMVISTSAFANTNCPEIHGAYYHIDPASGHALMTLSTAYTPGINYYQTNSRKHTEFSNRLFQRVYETNPTVSSSTSPGRITGEYGEFYNFSFPCTSGSCTSHDHNGVDQSCGGSVGQVSLFAPISGVVRNAGGSSGTIAIYNADMDATMLVIHCVSMAVSPGNNVEVGQYIGKAGNAGTTTAHVHTEFRAGDVSGGSCPCTDPAPANTYDPRLAVALEPYLAVNGISTADLQPNTNFNLEFLNSANAGDLGTYEVHLSDANGSFADYTVIGEHIPNSSTINLRKDVTCTIPANTPYGEGYKLRVAARTSENAPIFVISKPNTSDLTIGVDNSCVQGANIDFESSLISNDRVIRIQSMAGNQQPNYSTEKLVLPGSDHWEGELVGGRRYRWTLIENGEAVDSGVMSLSNCNDPNVFPANASLSAASGAPGDVIQVSFDQTIDPADHPEVTVRAEYRLSSSSTSSANPLWTDSDNSIIGGGDTSDGESTSFTVPNAPAGQYYVQIRVDQFNAVDEGPNESDNVIALPFTITGSGGGENGIDVFGTGGVLSQTEIAPGEDFTTSFTQHVSDPSSIPSGTRVYVRYWLSTSATNTAGAIAMGTDYSTLGGTDGNDPEAINYTTDASITPGQYYVWISMNAPVSTDFTESNPDNNAIVLPLTITGGSNGGSTADVTAETPQLSATSGPSGAAVTVSFDQTISPADHVLSESVKVEYYINSNCTLTGATLLDSDFSSIGNGDSADGESEVLTPSLPPGDYQIILKLDSENIVAEGTAGEANNVVCLPYTITEDGPEPCTVGEITLSNLTATSINLSWPGSFSATGYSIELTPEGGTTSTLSNSSGTSRDLNNLTPGTTYTVRIRANCGNTLSLWEEATFTTPSLPCGVPSNLEISNLTHDGVTVSWDPGDNASISQIEYGPVGGLLTLTTNGGVTTRNLSLDDPATDHVIRIRSVCDNGMSAWGEIFFTTLAEPCGPLSIQVSNVTESTASIFIIDPSDANNYQLEVSVNGGTPQLSSTTERSNLLENLPASATVLVRVRAMCSTVISAWAETTFMTDDPPCDLGLDLIATDPTCNLPNGMITANVTEANGPVNYVWSSGATASSIANLTPGAYALTITDGNNCTATDAVSIVNQGESPDTGFTPIITELTVTAEAIPQPGATHLWLLGNGDTRTGSTLNYTYSESGTYQLTLEVTNACGTETETESVTVTSPNNSNSPFGDPIVSSLAFGFFGKVTIENIPATDVDEIAAFDVTTGQLIGKGSFTVVGSDAFITGLVIYIDDPVTTATVEGLQTGNSFELRLWDASEDLVLAYPITFNDWGNTNGAPYPPYSDFNQIYDFSLCIEDTHTLQAGTTLMGFGVNFGDNNSVEEVFAELIANGTLQSVSILTASGYQTFDVSLPSFLNSLEEITPGASYFVRVSETVTFTVCGSPILDGFVTPLVEGWNPVACIGDDPVSIETAFASQIATGRVQYIVAFDPVNGYRIWNRDFPSFLNTLSECVDGMGLLIFYGPPNFGPPTGGGAPTKKLGEASPFTGMYVVRTSIWPSAPVSLRGEDGEVFDYFIEGEDGFSQVLNIKGDNPFTEEVEGAAAGTKMVVYIGDNPTTTSLTFLPAHHLQLLNLKREERIVPDVMRAFPNPIVTGHSLKVIVNLLQPEERLRVEVVDQLGRVQVLQQRKNLPSGSLELQINSNDLYQGLQYLRVFGGQGLLDQQVIIRK